MDSWDAVGEYFECIAECDLDDKDCTKECLIELKEADELRH